MLAALKTAAMEFAVFEGWEDVPYPEWFFELMVKRTIYRNFTYDKTSGNPIVRTYFIEDPDSLVEYELVPGDVIVRNYKGEVRFFTQEKFQKYFYIVD